MLLTSLLTISATHIQATLEDSLYDMIVAQRGEWCCGSVCGSSYKSVSPRPSAVCSFEISPDKWWFIAESSSSPYVLCFSKAPSKGMPSICSPHVQHSNTHHTSFFSQLMRLVTFTVIVLTPAFLTFLNPFDLRY